MTGNTRDYLADLANQKGVKLPGEQERDQAWASAKIDELKAMPDANYREITDAEAEKIDAGIEKAIRGIRSWTFEG